MSKRRRLEMPLERPAVTRRRLEVAMLLSRGFTNKEIAAKLGLSERTVEHHVALTLQMLGMGRIELLMTSAGAAGLADRLGLGGYRAGSR